MMNYIYTLVQAKLKDSDEKGQGMVEYALIIAFVAAIAIVVLKGGLTDAVGGAFTKATSVINAAGN